MKASEVKLTDLDALIASDEQTGGKPVLPAGSRDRVEDELELMVIWPEVMQRHVHELLRRLGGRLRHTELLHEDIHSAILEVGFSVLDDAALAALALNPVALCVIHGWWYARGKVPDVWNGALTMRSRIELEERGHGPMLDLLHAAVEAAKQRGWKPGMPSPFDHGPHGQ